MACLRYRRGKWTVDYRDALGKRRWMTCRNREDAEKSLSEVISDREQPLLTNMDPDLTLLDYSRQWEKVVETSLEKKTLRSYEQILRLHLIPTFGSIPIRKLHRNAIKILLSDKLRGGLSSNTVRLIYATLRTILNAAIDDGLIKVNPAAGIGRKLKLSTAPSHREEEIKAFDRNQLAAFLDQARSNAKTPYFELFLLMSRTGLRPGEAYGLSWDDMDFTRREIRINKSLGMGKTIKATKTNRPRVVDMSETVHTVLQEWREKCELEALGSGREMTPIIFTNKADGYLDESKVRKVFKHILKAAKLLSHFIPYSLRHTFASQLLAEGVSVAYVSDMLGHSDIRLTVNLYGRWLPKGNRQNVNRLDAIYSEAQKNLVVANSGSKTDLQKIIDSKVIDNKWSRRVGLNHRPADYESAALPLSYAGISGD